MSNTNDGGNAFPSVEVEGTVFFGITPRDYFAAHASDSDVLYHRSQLYHAGGHIKEPTREECKYAYADAMIAARAKERG